MPSSSGALASSVTGDSVPEGVLAQGVPASSTSPPVNCNPLDTLETSQPLLNIDCGNDPKTSIGAGNDNTSSESQAVAQILEVGNTALLAYDALLLDLKHLHLPSPPPDAAREATNFVNPQEGGSTTGERIEDEPFQSMPIESEPISSTVKLLFFYATSDKVNIRLTHVLQGPLFENPFLRLSSDAISVYFGTIIDIRNALALRRSVFVVEIGCMLGDLAQKFNRHDKDTSVIEAVDRELEAIQQAVIQNNMDIKYEALECFRSTYNPELGKCFFEEHQFILPEIYEYLDAHKNATAACSQFVNDPTSLRENRLSRFLPAQN